MEIITEVGPGSGEGGFRPLLRELHASPKPVNYISQHPLLPPLLLVMPLRVAWSFVSVFNTIIGSTLY